MDDVVRTEINEHSHGALAASVEIAEIKISLKCRAEKCQDQLSTVINSCTDNISQATQGELPSTDSIRQIAKRRNKLNLASSNPADVSEIVILDECKEYMTNNGKRENFLIAENGQRNNRIFIFGIESWTKYLLDSDVWYADCRVLQ